VFFMTDAAVDTSSNKPIVIDRYRFKSDNSGYLDRRRDHIYLFDVASKQIDTLTTGDVDDSGALFSPDGKWISFSSERDAGEDPDRINNSDLYVIEAAKGAKPRRLTTWQG